MTIIVILLILTIEIITSKSHSEGWIVTNDYNLLRFRELSARVLPTGFTRNSPYEAQLLDQLFAALLFAVSC